MSSLFTSKTIGKSTMNIYDFFQEDYIFHQYQPMFYLPEGRKVFAYEGLMRNVSNINPDRVFQSASKANILYKLDTMSIQKAISTFFNQQIKDCRLFLNIYITTILHPNFMSFFDRLCNLYPSLPNLLFLEINETSLEEFWDIPILESSLQSLKRLGVKVAIDDFGQGSTSIKRLIEFEPDCVKLDRFFANNLKADQKKQRFLSLLKSFYADDTILVLEGIEEKEDLKIAEQIGIKIVQGFYLGRPQKLEIIGA